MTYEQADPRPDFREEIGTPLARPRWGRRLHLVPDPQPSDAESALREVEAELEAVRARGPVIAATVDRLNRAVERLAAELRAD
ncbi:hypothetical protein ABZY20_18855 [Streptomyces sp. NPDC006624]|uniref:hypothetical protein n=1 Tax=Streptomyces sp. NPDC006624 TaxID=3154892 RepID=UPI0033A174E4